MDDYRNIEPGDVIPKQIVDFELSNVDNAGEYPVSATSSVPKDAYMIGISLITEHQASGDGYVGGYIDWSASGNAPANRIKGCKVYCNDAFNGATAAGTNVSGFFIYTTEYLPAGIDYGLLLFVAPQPGTHSFRVVLETTDGTTFEHNTTPINFI